MKPSESDAEPTSEDPGASENAIAMKEVEGKSQGQIARERFLRHKGAVASLVVLALIVLLAFSSIGVTIFGLDIPGWWRWGYRQQLPLYNGTRPTLVMPWDGPFTIGQHPFGQDTLGRDVFAVTMRATQTSLMVMIVISLLAVGIGTVVGAVAGYFRGWADTLLMRVTDLVITLPTIAIGAVLGLLVRSPSPLILGVVLGLISWTGTARLIRGDVLSLREREFVDAAKVAGVSTIRIIFKHILPNAIGVMIVNATLLMASAILFETALSYLGFGITEPNVSLGKMIADYESAFRSRPWLFWWPGAMIIVIALAVNFVGDGLRDAFDPRQGRVPSRRLMAKADQRAAAAAASVEKS